jgi:hypothetical protein
MEVASFSETSVNAYHIAQANIVASYDRDCPRFLTTRRATYMASFAAEATQTEQNRRRGSASFSGRTNYTITTTCICKVRHMIYRVRQASFLCIMYSSVQKRKLACRTLYYRVHCTLTRLSYKIKIQTHSNFK